MREDLSREEVLQHIEEFVTQLLTEARIEQPPVDAIALAQGHLRMSVCLDRRQQQRGRAQRVAGSPMIFLRPEPTEERHQWTIAHEIGEHFKSELLQRLGIEPGQTRPMMGEALANLFADHLLVPTPWLRTMAVECGYDLLQLKAHFRTASHEVLAWRLLDLPAPCIITIVDNDRVQRRRSNTWRTRKVLEAVERACQQQVHQASEPRVLRAEGWTVQGWPIHRPDWKREILRSVVESE